MSPRDARKGIQVPAVRDDGPVEIGERAVAGEEGVSHMRVNRRGRRRLPTRHRLTTISDHRGLLPARASAANTASNVGESLSDQTPRIIPKDSLRLKLVEHGGVKRNLLGPNDLHGGSGRLKRDRT